jgi:hypothetical protein
VLETGRFIDMGRKKRIRNSDGKLVMVPVDSKKESKRAGKVDIILAKSELKTAKGYARKWLFMLVAILLGAYLLLSSGAGSGALDLIKGFLPGGE